MKNLRHKLTVILFVAVMTTTLFAPFLHAQDQDTDLYWPIYEFYSSLIPGIDFQSSIFLDETIRKQYGSSYIIGYMDGVNSDRWGSAKFFNKEMVKSKDWYERGYTDGLFDRFKYINNQPISLAILNAQIFSFFDYGTPYRAVLDWLRTFYYARFNFNTISPIYAHRSQIRDFEYYNTSPERTVPLPVDTTDTDAEKPVRINPKKTERALTRMAEARNRVRVAPVSKDIVKELQIRKPLNALKVRSGLRRPGIYDPLNQLAKFPNVKKMLNSGGFNGRITIVEADKTGHWNYRYVSGHFKDGEYETDLRNIILSKWRKTRFNINELRNNFNVDNRNISSFRNIRNHNSVRTHDRYRNGRNRSAFKENNRRDNTRTTNRSENAGRTNKDRNERDRN